MTSAVRRWGAAWCVAIFPRHGETGSEARTSGYAVEIHGELDAASRQELGVQLRRMLEFGAPVTLDLTHLKFCGVAAIEEILQVADLARHSDVSLSIIAPDTLAPYFALSEDMRDR
ncbi:STAS domain-containing protein [Hoyosella altamirensis]|uniref:Anti-anti-sigma regulatory factor n=1 Tax=Hoyosella altamirensis TaxID=616997 RepID=A0A839RRR3_9ACTN|nr:STAS domain-containing protein [Hoyosella altamirensis]MBB3038796.1 anti-anti-sigma regulatory factor [Hoyosella altamirensis]